MAEKKQDKHVCKEHSFIVTNTRTSGGQSCATQLRCSHCLLPVSLEELESKEWREKNNI